MILTTPMTTTHHQVEDHHADPLEGPPCGPPGGPLDNNNPWIPQMPNGLHGAPRGGGGPPGGGPPGGGPPGGPFPQNPPPN